MWSTNIMFLILMATVISAIDDNEESASLFSDPPKPWIIYTVYAHLGLVAVLYIIIIVLVIYYHQIVKKTSDKRNTTNPNYYEPNEKGNNMEKKTHELYKREKGVDNHYDVNPKIKFNGVVGSEKQNIGKDEDPYITFKDPKKSTIPPKSYENIVLKGVPINAGDKKIVSDNYDMANGPFANNKADGNYDIPKKPLKTPDAGNYINVTLKPTPASKTNVNNFHTAPPTFPTKDDEEIYKFNHLNMNGPVNDMQENYECFNVGSPDDDIYNEIGQGEDIYEILPDEK